MKRPFLLSLAVSILMVLGCFDSHENDDQAEGRDDATAGQNDETSGANSDRRTGNSDDNDVEDILELSPEEGAEIAADAVCGYFEKCQQQTVRCEVSSREYSSGSESPSEEIIDVNCEVRELDMSFDNCREEVGVTVQAGLECADVTSEQSRDIEACLSALVNAECVEITDKMLREYEEAIASGEDTTMGNMPDACLGIENIFECAERDIDPEGSSLSCVLDQIAACTCLNGQKGTQTCLSDRTYSPCVCSSDVAPTVGRAGTSGSAGFIGVAGAAGGAASGTVDGGVIPITPPCEPGERRSCACPDGLLGIQFCAEEGGWLDSCSCPEP